MSKVSKVSKAQVKKLIGKPIYAVRKDGSVVTGKLVELRQNKLVLAPLKKDKGKVVKTKAILPLVLFDLLAIGTLGFWGGGGGGCGCGNFGCGGGCGGGGYGGGGYGGGYGGGGYGGGYGSGYGGGPYGGGGFY
jgi:Predicted membrane protein